MLKRFEERVVHTLSTLTLRKAVALIVGTATALSFTAAFVERLIDPEFKTLGEALWWAVSTVTTTGYGDILPSSSPGRIVATALMLTGLAFIPLITSVVVAILVQQRTRPASEFEAAELREILDRLDRIERKLGVEG